MSWFQEDFLRIMSLSQAKPSTHVSSDTKRNSCTLPGVQSGNFVQRSFADVAMAVAALPDIFRKISQNFSPAGVTSPFVARAMPTDATSVVPVRGRYSRRLPATSLKIVLDRATP